MAVESSMRKRKREARHGTEAGEQPPASSHVAPAEARAHDHADVLSSRNGESAGLLSSLGPILRVKLKPSNKLWKELVLSLESGVMTQVAWSLNVLQVLSFTDKDRWQRSLTGIAQLPDIVDALSILVEDGRVGGGSGLSSVVLSRLFTDGTSSLASEERGMVQREGGGVRGDVEGLRVDGASGIAAGIRREQISSGQVPSRRKEVGCAGGRGLVLKTWEEGELWWRDDGILTSSHDGKKERLQCAVAASNVLRNLSFFAEHVPALASQPQLIGRLVSAILDWRTEDAELVTSVLETIENLSAGMRLSTFCNLENGHSTHLPPPPPRPLFSSDQTAEPCQSQMDDVASYMSTRGSSTKRGSSSSTSSRCGVRSLLWALQEMLWHPIRAWHTSAALSLSRLVSSGHRGNDAFLLPYSARNEIFQRLGMLLIDSDLEVKAAAVTALAAFSEVSRGSRLRILQTPRLVRRLLQCVSVFPPTYVETTRKTAFMIEQLVQEPEGRQELLLNEDLMIALACSESCKAADAFGRILMTLSTKNGSSLMTRLVGPKKNIWALNMDR